MSTLFREEAGASTRLSGEEKPNCQNKSKQFIFLPEGHRDGVWFPVPFTLRVLVGDLPLHGDDVGGCDVLRMPGIPGKQQAAHVAAIRMEGERDRLGGFERQVIHLFLEPIPSQYLPLLHKKSFHIIPGQVCQHLRLEIAVGVLELQ